MDGCPVMFQEMQYQSLCMQHVGVLEVKTKGAIAEKGSFVPPLPHKTDH